MKPELTARYPTDLPAWVALKEHWRSQMRGKHLAELFARDSKRAGRFVLTAGDLTLDYSKNHVTDRTLSFLFSLARSSDRSRPSLTPVASAPRPSRAGSARGKFRRTTAPQSSPPRFLRRR